MPELPEVEIMRRYFDEAALRQKITHIDVGQPQDRMFKNSVKELRDSLIGSHFTETERIGKYLFAKISNGKWLHLHFGMTGSLRLFTDEESKPRFTRFALHFDDDTKLAFVDSRKFGKVEITDSPAEYQLKNKIGSDLLETGADDFINALKDRNIVIKSALLEQKKFAGIGNWIADEMLFEVGIHPETVCKNLTKKELEDLLKSAQKIVKTAIKKDTHYGDFPDDFFVNYRKKNTIHPDYPNSKIEKLVVGGRGTFIVPEKQKKKD